MDFQKITSLLGIPRYSVAESRKLISRLVNGDKLFGDMKQPGQANATLPCIIEVQHEGEYASYRHLCVMFSACRQGNGIRVIEAKRGDDLTLTHNGEKIVSTYPR